MYPAKKKKKKQSKKDKKLIALFLFLTKTDKTIQVECYTLDTR